MPRRPNDFYPTPTSLTLALLSSVPSIKGKVVYEPCAGDGAITSVLRDYGGLVWTNDIDVMQPADFHYDARTTWPQPLQIGGYSVDWVITNPPFNGAEEIWHTCMKQENVRNLAFLLRLSFLEPVKSREWLAHSPPDGMIVLPRTSFTQNGKTDSVTCAWMVWTVEPMVEPAIQVYTKQQLAQLVADYNKHKPQDNDDVPF